MLPRVASDAALTEEVARRNRLQRRLAAVQVERLIAFKSLRDQQQRSLQEFTAGILQ